MKANYHTHTKRCGHATGTMEEYIINAIEAGYKVLGFSDHAPFPGVVQEGIRMTYDMLDSYIQEFQRLKEKYQDQIELHIGLEAEYVEKFEDYYRYLLKEKGIEYLLLGQHCFINDDNQFEWYGRSRAYKRVEDMIKGIKSGLFSYCAHPDIFIDENSIHTKQTREFTKQIIEASIENDCPLEINAEGICHAFRLEIEEYYPYPSFWKRVSKTKAKVLIGVDAHKADAFKSVFVKECYRIADQCNVKLIDTIEFKKV